MSFRKFRRQSGYSRHGYPARFITLFLTVSLIFGLFAPISTVAAQETAFCGLEAHSHTEECYRVFLSAEEETVTASTPETTPATTPETTPETQPETTPETTPETQPDYIISETPVCGKDVHTHSLACYSDPSADLQTTVQWEADLPQTLSGNWSEDLLAVAVSQLGCRESLVNYTVDPDGVTLSGYNRYGAWYSSFTMDENQPYLPWNVTFLFFSIYYSGISDFPLEETCPEWIESLAYYDLFRAPGAYTPAPGDLIFTDTDGDGEADRAGIVKTVTDTAVTAIEGDAADAVAEVEYLCAPTDPESPVIIGYADMAQAMADAIPENGNTALLPTLAAGQYLYIDFSNANWWDNDGAETRLWYKPTSGSWRYSEKAELVQADKMYRVILPGDMDFSSSQFTLARIQGGSTSTGSTSWANTYNQIDDLSLQADKNLYIINANGNGGSWDGSWYGSLPGSNAATPTVYFSVPADWIAAGHTVKVFAQYGQNESTEQVLHNMSDTGQVDSEGRKIYRYDFSENDCPYGGFYRIYFQAFNSSGNWVTQYEALNCTEYNDSTWTQASTVDGKHYKPGSGWGSYAPGSNPDVNVESSLPAIPSGYRRVFYDASLSALSYEGDVGSAWEIPQRGSNVIYCWATGGSTNQRYTMTRLANNFQSGGRTWTDLYYVDIPSGCTKVTFASFALTSATNYGGHGESTKQQTIPSGLSQPCFYADSSDMSIYGTASDNTRGGYWAEVFSLRNAEAGKNTDVVDIKKETFTEAEDTLYVSSTFYDYYTDYELNGYNRDNYKVNNGASFQNWYPFRHFNLALSDYYENAGVKIPLYVGHFQPAWDDWGYRFVDIEGDSEGTFNLYGFMDGRAYGSNGNTDQKYFMSVNNSYMDVHANPNKSSCAAQGLVNSSLSSGTLLTSQGETALPFFSESFLTGSNSKNAVLGQVYHNVAFPFTKQDIDNNGVEYWVFDSANTTLALQQDSASGEYYLKQVSSTNQYKNVNSSSGTGDVATAYGFFPFNATSSDTHANTYNYGFGTRLDLTFRLTEDGKVLSNVDTNGDGVADKRVPIEFNFSGDDDVWVFVDGKLALDVGGDHGRVTGSLNFATMQASVSAVKDSPGTKHSGTFTIEGARTDEHTLTLFYMERGMWESNMKITYNFPDENQLEVEKQVDTSQVNDLFLDVFEGQSLFSFNIQNLATHFGEVSATGASHDPITWDIGSSTLTRHSDNTFSRGTYQGRSNALHWNAQYDDTGSEYRHKRYGVLTLPSAINITQMTRLSFDIYIEDSNGFSLSNMYLQLLDADTASADLVNNTLTAGDSNALGCIGTYLSGKTYGSTSTAGNTWVTVTLDLSKLDAGSGFDFTRVKHLRFGYDQSRNIYLSNITFQPAAVQSNPTGFITQQYDVPSYGSATSGKLQNAAGAVYTSNLSSASYVVDGNGMFSLESGETVNFHDQFRRGSYIYLEEVLSAQEKALFNTVWTMYENGIPVTAFGDGSTLINPGTIPDMTDVSTTTVKDGRVERVVTGSIDGHQQKNGYTTQSNPGGFVFRSYSDPDSTELTTKLKVVFTNTVKTGSLTITKKDAQASSSVNRIDPDEEFTFIVRFYNVGGLGLEDQPITTVVKLKPGESETISGIPLNTRYTIYELKLDNEISLDSVSGSHTGFTSTTFTGTVDGTAYSGVDAYRVGGTLSSNQSVTFTNAQKPVVSLQVTKRWLDDDGQTLTNPPSTIYLRLQYRVKGSSTWNTHPSYSNVAFTPGYGTWTYTFAHLDQYNDYTSNSRKALEYRVIELDSAGSPVSGSVTLTSGGVSRDFTVTYGTPSAFNASGIATQTITNTLQSKVSVSVEKQWCVPSGVTKSQIPVQLQRRTGSGTFAAVETVTLSSENQWQHIFTDLDRKNASGAVYEYRVVELDAAGNALIPGTDPAETTIGSARYLVTASASQDTQDSNRTNWVITNTLVPQVTLQITKRNAVATEETLPGVTFQLIKLENPPYRKELTTDSAGTVAFTGLTEGTYTLTETQTAPGFTLLSAPIEIVITKHVDPSGVITYTASADGFDSLSLGQISAAGVYTLELDIYNKPNIVMPATGGSHGFEFWILGGLCLTAMPLLLHILLPRKPKGKYLRK